MKRLLALFALLLVSCAELPAAKVTALTELTTPASGDLLYLVDVSDTTDDPAGSDKKITYANLFAGHQPLDASLTAFAALTTAANKGIYFSGADTPGTFDLTAFGRTLGGYASAAAFKAGLDLEVGVDFQAYRAELGKLGLQGSDIASSGSIDIGASAGEFIDITGTTSITALGTSTAGTRRILRFTGALTFTHHASALILPGAANITTVNGDTAEMVSLGSGNWKCVDYTRASALPVISVTTANGVSATNTAGALSFTLGAITPSSVLSDNIVNAADTAGLQWLAGQWELIGDLHSADDIGTEGELASATLSVAGVGVIGTIQTPTSTPASAGADGTAGTITWDASYIYVCTATNTWKRVAITTW